MKNRPSLSSPLVFSKSEQRYFPVNMPQAVYGGRGRGVTLIAIVSTHAQYYQLEFVVQAFQQFRLFFNIGLYMTRNTVRCLTQKRHKLLSVCTRKTYRVIDVEPKSKVPQSRQQLLLNISMKTYSHVPINTARHLYIIIRKLRTLLLRCTFPDRRLVRPILCSYRSGRYWLPPMRHSCTRLAP